LSIHVYYNIYLLYMYICIYVVGALRSIDESHIVFKPCIDGDLESYRLTLTPNLKYIRRRIRVFVRLRLKMDFYTNLRPTRLWVHEQGGQLLSSTTKTHICPWIIISIRTEYTVILGHIPCSQCNGHSIITIQVFSILLFVVNQFLRNSNLKST
jgi:hypothetical protein